MFPLCDRIYGSHKWVQTGLCHPKEGRAEPQRSSDYPTTTYMAKAFDSPGYSYGVTHTPPSLRRASSMSSLSDRPTTNVTSDFSSSPPITRDDTFLDRIHRAERNLLSYVVRDVEVLLQRGGAAYSMYRGDTGKLVRREAEECAKPLLLDYAEKGQGIDVIKKEHLQSTKRAAIAFCKSMIGTAILYLPKMFYNGGLGFSVVVLIAVACLSTYNMVLLSEAHDRLQVHSYGAIAMAAYGDIGEQLIDGLLVVTQTGWVCTYFIFVQTNLTDALINGMGFPESSLTCRTTLILLQLFLYIPLSWIRRLRYLGMYNLIANMCISLGVVVCLGYATYVLADHGPASFHWVNHSEMVLFLGAIATAFEGMSLVLPIKRSMKHPEKFSGMVVYIMMAICLLFLSIGIIGYLAFGDADTKTFMTLNLPVGSPLGPTVQLAYCLAVLFTYPLQLFPATQIMERYLFHDRLHNPSVRKTIKNMFRAFTVVVTAVVALFCGGRAYDNFVSLIGSFCSVPLGLIIPIVLHLRLYWDETPPGVKAFRIVLVVVGLFGMVISVYTSIATWQT